MTPLRSRAYLEFVRQHPCVFCPASGEGIHAHHHGRRRGGGGMGIKPCDLFTVPLCHLHHGELHKRGAVEPFSRAETQAAIDSAMILLLRSALIEKLEL